MNDVYANVQLERIADAISGTGGGQSFALAVNVPEMVGASSDAAGSSGLVPAPAAGDEGKFLTGAGTWEEVAAPGGGGGSSWDYSTSEVDTGQKWINGKPIYCLVEQLNVPQGSNYITFPNLPAIETLVKCDVTCLASFGEWFYNPHIYLRALTAGTGGAVYQSLVYSEWEGTGFFKFFYTKP